MDSMNAKFDIWAIGQNSKKLAGMLSSSGKNDNSVSLVITDRMFDFVSACGHSSTVLNRIIGCLDHFGSCDVQVNTTPFFNVRIFLPSFFFFLSQIFFAFFYD
jgi:hypothetical protein